MLVDILLSDFHWKTGWPFFMKLCTKLANIPQEWQELYCCVDFIHRFKAVAVCITPLPQSLGCLIFSNYNKNITIKI